MAKLRLGIVGAGMIGGVVAEAANASEAVVPTAVASRRFDAARLFARQYDIPGAFRDVESLLAVGVTDAIYVATPTVLKEGIAIKAARAGRHVLVDKPFADSMSLERIMEACRIAGVAFMDATHLTHHPRTLRLKRELDGLVGGANAVLTNFLFPFSDTSNIRFDPIKEPTGALGDMGWYAMRAIAEYMPKATKLEKIMVRARVDRSTGAIMGATGLLLFAGHMRSTFNVGYDAGVCNMDLELVGSTGHVHVDDFVLDFCNSFAFTNPQHTVGFTHRVGMATPPFSYVATPSVKPQAQLMIEAFARLTNEPDGEMAAAHSDLSQRTQALLDAVCQAAATPGPRYRYAKAL